jgi:4-hydroxy-2-oxoheptanedioate aldolase
MTSPPARSELLTGPAKHGALCTLGDTFAAEVLGYCGFDWICIDRQHGSFGEGVLYGLLQAFSASDTPVLVRVPGNEPAAIMRALDAGAEGVIVPLVEDATAARLAVSACRYPPHGIRSWGPTRVRHRVAGYSSEVADQRVVCAVMVETALGLENLEEIAAVPGLDCIFAGPSDLALALGAVPSLLDVNPVVADAIARIPSACAGHGKVAGIFTGGAEQAAIWRSRGFHLISLQSDRLLMSERAGQILREIRDTHGRDLV